MTVEFAVKISLEELKELKKQLFCADNYGDRCNAVRKIVESGYSRAGSILINAIKVNRTWIETVKIAEALEEINASGAISCLGNIFLDGDGRFSHHDEERAKIVKIIMSLIDKRESNVERDDIETLFIHALCKKGENGLLGYSRDAVIEALGQIGSPRAIEELVSILRKEGENYVAAFALEKAGWIPEDVSDDDEKFKLKLKYYYLIGFSKRGKFTKKEIDTMFSLITRNYIKLEILKYPRT